MEEILLNVECREVRCAHLKHGQLYNLITERKNGKSLTGNIYKGRVANLLNNIQSAFINIGEEDNGFIHYADAVENNFKILNFAQEHGLVEGTSTMNRPLQNGQWLMTQVIKDPIGAKGARLTSFISIPGRYVVLLPTSSQRSVSKKIVPYQTRSRLGQIMQDLNLPSDIGLICRTASKSATKEKLQEEVDRLLVLWKTIVINFLSSKKSTCLHKTLDLVEQVILSAVEKKCHRVLIDDYNIYQHCQAFFAKNSREHFLKIEFYRDKIPMFERFGVEREIEKALKKKIWLPGGGYIFFESTEAMHTIDVNSGRSTEKFSANNLEETIVRINLEAAEEISRQLRLRNIGGIVVCDFIDMTSVANQKRVLDRLKEHMDTDPARCSVLNMSRFGTIQMTRQRIRESLEQTMLSSCPYCDGSGCVKNHETVSIDIERSLKKILSWFQGTSLNLLCHPDLKTHLTEVDKNYLSKQTMRKNILLTIEEDDTLHLNDFLLIDPETQKSIS